MNDSTSQQNTFIQAKLGCNLIHDNTLNLLSNCWNSVKCTSEYFYSHKLTSPLGITSTMVPVSSPQKTYL